MAPRVAPESRYTDRLAQTIFGDTNGDSMKKCAVDNCTNIVRSNGICEKHYYRLRRYGDVNITKRATKSEVLAWIRSNLDCDELECLIWPFSFFGSGYGRVQIDGKESNASRLVCIIAHGEPECSKMQAAHSCGKGHLGCVNPKHLRWATVAENEADKEKHGTKPSGSKNGMAALSEREVINIISLYNSGASYQYLANKFNIHYQTAYKIIKRKRWMSLTKDMQIRGDK